MTRKKKRSFEEDFLTRFIHSPGTSITNIYVFHNKTRKDIAVEKGN